MPIRVTTVAAQDSAYGRPFVGPVNHTSQIPVPIGSLTSAEVDSKGYIKPGLPLMKTGLLVGVSGVVHGVVIEPIKVANSNVAGDLTAAGTVQLALATVCQVNRAIVEKNLGRVLNANEVAGFSLAGSLVKLL